MDSNTDAFTLNDVTLEGAGGGVNLSARVAAVLLQKIREGGFAPGVRLPTEHMMAQRFGVSRTVIREAIVSLKAEGVVETRQGSGAFVRQPNAKSAFTIDPLTTEPVHHLLSLIELRRAIDSEIAALAAERRDEAGIEEIRRALSAIEDAVTKGGSGVPEDVQFHISIARATGNPYWVKLVEMFAPQLHTAVTLTRANEARRHDYVLVAKGEHQRLLDAIVAGDTTAARAAAIAHMDGAAGRVSSAGPEFWASEGKEGGRLILEQARK